jgi:sugar phosphate isomerase/epimerase
MWDRSKHHAIMEKAQTVITRLAQLGGRTLGTSVGRAPAPKTPEQLDAQAEILRKIIALGQAHGVVLNLHNHTYEVENGMHDLGGTLARIPDVKLGPDLNWLVRAGVDPVEFIHRFGKQIVFMHIRDQKADGTWSEAVGEGNMDYVGIANALHGIPFTGDAVIELAVARPELPITPAHSLINTRRLGGTYFSRNALGMLARTVVMRGFPNSYAGRTLLVSAKGVIRAWAV